MASSMRFLRSTSTSKSCARAISMLVMRRDDSASASARGRRGMGTSQRGWGSYRPPVSESSVTAQNCARDPGRPRVEGNQLMIGFTLVDTIPTAYWTKVYLAVLFPRGQIERPGQVEIRVQRVLLLIGVTLVGLAPAACARAVPFRGAAAGGRRRRVHSDHRGLYHRAGRRRQHRGGAAERRSDLSRPAGGDPLGARDDHLRAVFLRGGPHRPRDRGGARRSLPGGGPRAHPAGRLRDQPDAGGVPRDDDARGLPGRHVPPAESAELLAVV